MMKHLLTMIAIALAVCLTGCTDEAADDGAEAPAEDTAAAPAETPADAPAADAAAEPAASTADAGDAAAMTLAKLDGVDVEAGCAKCAYSIAGVTECMLAMKTGDTAYIVEGTGIISDDVGLCGATRPAKVSGEARDETHFVASDWAFTDE